MHNGTINNPSPSVLYTITVQLGRGLRGNLRHITAFLFFFHSKAKSDNKKQPCDYFWVVIWRETPSPLDGLAAVVVVTPPAMQ